MTRLVIEIVIILLLQEGMDAGVFHAAEPAMVKSVLAFDRRPVQDIMTPGEKLVFLNRDDSRETVWHKIVVSAHSHFPVYEGNRDRVVGVVSVKGIDANLAAGAGVKLADLMTPPVPVPEEQSVAAFATGQLGSALREGAAFVWLGHRIEIIDLDRQRIDKVLVTREAPAP
jgi:CBS domain containing-hemolysin-like protein